MAEMKYPDMEESLRRLEQAARFVSDIDPKEFNIEHWWLPDGQYYDEDRHFMHKVADGDCGCAIGHMIQKGLFELNSDLLDEDRERIFVIIGDTFGIPYKLAEFMFDQYSYPGGRRKHVTPALVASRIRFVIAELAK